MRADRQTNKLAIFRSLTAGQKINLTKQSNDIKGRAVPLQQLNLSLFSIRFVKQSYFYSFYFSYFKRHLKMALRLGFGHR